MSVIYSIVIFSFFHFLPLNLGWSTDGIPDFSDTSTPVNSRLFREYRRFQQTLASHPVYQPSKAVTNPLVDYILFLTSYSENKETAIALDHMLKTSGPFGFSAKPADEQEKVFIAAAAQAIAQTHHDLIAAPYVSSNPEHLTEIQRLQGLAIAGGAIQHPYHPVITLPSSAQPLADGLKPALNQSGRWQNFLDLLKDKNVSKRQFAAKTVTGKAKADWANDVILCGFQMGALPDVESRSSPQPRNYLDDAWGEPNSWMENQHNYVQWWFPIHTVGSGDRIAPRFIEETRQTLIDHPAVLTEVQKMLRMSFARKVTFWGQKLTQFRVMMPIDLKEDQALGKATYGNTWHQNWIVSSHNYSRMTRFLMCFHLFGLSEEENSLYAYLNKTVKEENTSPKQNTSIKSSLDNFWLQAKVGKPRIRKDEGHIPTPAF